MGYVISLKVNESEKVGEAKIWMIEELMDHQSQANLT